MRLRSMVKGDRGHDVYPGSGPLYGGAKELVVKGYVNASFDTDPDDSKSQTGYVYILNGGCRCQNRWISGRGSRTVHLRSMVTGGGGHDVYPGSGPLYGGNTLLPA